MFWKVVIESSIDKTINEVTNSHYVGLIAAFSETPSAARGNGHTGIKATDAK